jgi:hypothetical protein
LTLKCLLINIYLWIATNFDGKDLHVSVPMLKGLMWQREFPIVKSSQRKTKTQRPLPDFPARASVVVWGLPSKTAKYLQGIHGFIWKSVEGFSTGIFRKRVHRA